jgi:hypothetical protein
LHGGQIISIPSSVDRVVNDADEAARLCLAVLLGVARVSKVLWSVQ